jgi:putative ABC transport system permease protein
MGVNFQANSIKTGLFLGYKSLKRESKKTTILTIILMSIVVINLAFLPSIISGVGQTFIDSSVDYSYGNLFIAPREGEDVIKNTTSVLKKIENLPGVEGVSSRYNIGATIKYKDKSLGVNVNSIDPEREKSVSKFHKKLISGSFLTENDFDKTVIGYSIAGNKEGGDLADSLGGVEVGEKVEIIYSNGVARNYTLKGIFEGDMAAVDWFVFVSKKEMESVINQEDTSTGILVKISEQGKEEEYRTQLLMSGIKGEVKTWNEKIEGVVEDILNSLGFLNFITFAISLFIALVALFIVTYINIANKKRQIGILKAIGITQEAIVSSYVFKSLFYTFIGIFVGGIFSVIIITYLNVNPLPFPTGDLRPVIKVSQILLALLFLSITAVFSGFFPSWRITNKSILEQIWGTK